MKCRGIYLENHININLKSQSSNLRTYIFNKLISVDVLQNDVYIYNNKTHLKFKFYIKQGSYIFTLKVHFHTIFVKDVGIIIVYCKLYKNNAIFFNEYSKLNINCNFYFIFISV